MKFEQEIFPSTVLEYSVVSRWPILKLCIDCIASKHSIKSATSIIFVMIVFQDYQRERKPGICNQPKQVITLKFFVHC